MGGASSFCVTVIGIGSINGFGSTDENGHCPPGTCRRLLRCHLPGRSGEDEPGPPIAGHGEVPRDPCRDEPFSARELDLLQKMPKLQRVICVTAAGWSPRVRPEVWHQWLAKARIQPPFPPVEIFNFDRPTRRIPLLAAALIRN